MSAREFVVGMLFFGCVHEATPPLRSSSTRGVEPSISSARPAPTSPPPAAGPSHHVFEITWERAPGDGAAAPEDFSENPFSGPTACNELRRVEQDIPLRFRSGAEPFAVFHGPMLRLVVPATRERPDVVYLTSDVWGIVVHAVAHPGDFVLHPARPIELDGIAVLRPAAVLAFAGAASPDRVGVAYRLESDEVLVMTPRTLEARVRCADLALDENSFSDHEGLGRSAQGQVDLRPNAGLSRVPGGRPFAHVAEPGALFAFVLGRTRGHVRVAVPRLTDTIFGWVPESMAEPIVTLGALSTLGHGAGTYVGRVPDSHFVTCPRDVWLFAEQGPSKERVGFLRAGTEFRLRTEREIDFVVDSLGLNRFWLEDRASFSVRKDDLAGCQRKASD